MFCPFYLSVYLQIRHATWTTKTANKKPWVSHNCVHTSSTLPTLLPYAECLSQCSRQETWQQAGRICRSSWELRPDPQAWTQTLDLTWALETLATTPWGLNIHIHEPIGAILILNPTPRTLLCHSSLSSSPLVRIALDTSILQLTSRVFHPICFSIVIACTLVPTFV